MLIVVARCWSVCKLALVILPRCAVRLPFFFSLSHSRFFKTLGISDPCKFWLMQLAEGHSITIKNGVF